MKLEQELVGKEGINKEKRELKKGGREKSECIVYVYEISMSKNYFFQKRKALRNN